MARSGRFGRAPRTAPSLTSTIIALAREYQRTRDQNIMDAWQKGGTFEGKKVTDNLVLSHWKERMNGVSKDDPLYDTYQNAVTNLDYTIHESKMTAQYAQSSKGPADDARMVAFYLGWAKKVPKDSEFYRVLQRDAGQFIRAKQQTSKAGIEAAKEQRYQAAQAETAKKYENAGNYLTDTLRRLNQSGYADGHLSNTLDAPDASSGSAGQDLTSFTPEDTDGAMKLLALITPYQPGQIEVAPGVTMPGTGTNAANTNVLYHSDTIDPATGKFKAITGADIIAELTKHDPAYRAGMPVDIPYLTSLLDRQNIGIQERIDRATKTGHMQDAAQATKEKGYIANLTRMVSAIPVEKMYMDLNTTWTKALNDPTISPPALDKAWQQYKSDLYGLAKDPRIAGNDNMRTRIIAEADGKTDTPTLAESFNGQDYNMTQPSRLSTNQQGALTQAREQSEAVLKTAGLLPTDPNKVVWTYGITGQDGIFMPDPNGTEIGSSSMALIASRGMQPQTVTVDDPRGGTGLSLVVTALPVYGIARDPLTGKELPKQNNQPIAYAYNFPTGGTNTLHYGYLVTDPSDASKTVMNFSLDSAPPWKDGLPVTPSSNNGNHYEVDFSSLLPTASVAPTSEFGRPEGTLSLAIDATKAGAVAGLPGFNVVGVDAPSRTNMRPVGTITFDPYAVARSSDVERSVLGGTDPTTDFTSLTVSNLMANEDGRNIMRNLDQRPEFKSQVTTDGYAYAGATQLPDGTWDQTYMDPSKLNAANRQASMATNAKNFVDFIKQGAATWQRLTTGSPYPGVTTGPAAGPNAGAQAVGPTGFAKLATDLVKGTPFEPIAQHLLDGTLTQKPQSELNDQTGFKINTGMGIRVPDIAEAIRRVSTVNTSSVGPMGGQTSVQTYQPPAQTQSQSYGGGVGPRAL